MARDRFADRRAVAVDDVQHAGGKADLDRGVGQQVAVERRHLRRLEHHRAAGGDRRRDLRHDLVQRIVPRRDHADDAERLAHDDRVADRLLERARRSRARRMPCVTLTGSCAWTVVDMVIGMPTSWLMVVAIAGTRASSASASFRSQSARSAGCVCDQPSSNARRAAATARSTSCGGPSRHVTDDLFG